MPLTRSPFPTRCSRRLKIRIWLRSRQSWREALRIQCRKLGGIQPSGALPRLQGGGRYRRRGSRQAAPRRFPDCRADQSRRARRTDQDRRAGWHESDVPGGHIAKRPWYADPHRLGYDSALRPPANDDRGRRRTKHYLDRTDPWRALLDANDVSGPRKLRRDRPVPELVPTQGRRERPCNALTRRPPNSKTPSRAGSLTPDHIALCVHDLRAHRTAIARA